MDNSNYQNLISGCLCFRKVLFCRFYLHLYTIKCNNHNISGLRSVEKSVGKKFSTLIISRYRQNMKVYIVNL